MPLTHPEPHWTVELARGAGVEIIGDIELFCRERAKIAPNAPFVAITGTNGKSTTTALIAHILREAGRDVQMGGNIGTRDPVARAAGRRPHPRHRVLVVPDRPRAVARPTVGVLLNLSPDHLDRHGTMEHYAAIKERLVAGRDTAVIGVDDAIAARSPTRCERDGVNVVRISVDAADATGVFADGTDARQARRTDATADR